MSRVTIIFRGIPREWTKGVYSTGPVCRRWVDECVHLRFRHVISSAAEWSAGTLTYISCNAWKCVRVSRAICAIKNHRYLRTENSEFSACPRRDTLGWVAARYARSLLIGPDDIRNTDASHLASSSLVRATLCSRRRIGSPDSVVYLLKVHRSKVSEPIRSSDRTRYALSLTLGWPKSALNSTILRCQSTRLRPKGVGLGFDPLSMWSARRLTGQCSLRARI